MTTLASTIQEVRQRIARAAKKPLNDQNTKATLIEPVQRALFTSRAEDLGHEHATEHDE